MVSGFAGLYYLPSDFSVFLHLGPTKVQNASFFKATTANPFLLSACILSQS
jgi:hypothetical protein